MRAAWSMPKWYDSLLRYLMSLTDFRQIKKRSRDPARSRSGKKGGKTAHNDNGQMSSGSDGESYGSADRRSEVGDHGGA